MTKLVLVAAAAASVTLAGCQTAGQQAPADAPKATAQLQPTKNNKAAGTVNFVQVGNKVRVAGNVSGLVPGREHGFHIHEAGDCSSGDGMSTKGHFNPYGKPHSNPGTAERHAGDMPALKADASGNASIDAELDVMSVTPGPASIIGRGLIV